MLVPPTTSSVADESSETVFPDMLMAEPPGISVWLSATNCAAELGVKVVPGRGMTG